MKVQNYVNHKRLHPLFHFVLTLLIFGLMVVSLLQLVNSLKAGEDLLPSIIFLLITFVIIVIFLLLRSYPLKAQDRAIRAEENLRHFVLTQKLLDPRLTIAQITALRFASDAEFPALAEKAVAERLTPDAIKKLIRSWRGDHDRI